MANLQKKDSKMGMGMGIRVPRSLLLLYPVDLWSLQGKTLEVSRMSTRLDVKEKAT